MLLLYALIAGIGIAKGQFDVSSLIVAGDRYVDKAHVPTPIAVRPNSAGYDGQFYFRLAIDPLPQSATGAGVTFDRPAYRSQRIGYPLIVFIMSLGQPALVPLEMVLVNLLGILVIARTAVALQKSLDLPLWFAPAIMAWPGLTVTILHDTTEIVAEAWLLIAILALASQQPRRFMITSAMTVLTRETSMIFFAFAALFGGPLTVRRIVTGLFPVVVYASWRLFLAHHWAGSGLLEQAFSGDLGWPLQGFFQTVRDSILLQRPLSPRPGPNAVRNVYVAIAALAIFATAALAAWRIPAALRGQGIGRTIAAGWIGLAIPLSMLTEQGPWIDQSGFFRAFTEFWAASLLVLGLTGLRLPRPMAVMAVPVWIGCEYFLF